MKIFVYEFLTGGGLYSLGQSPRDNASLLREGRAMVEAVTTDLAALEFSHVDLLCDARAKLNLHGIPTHSVSSEDEERDRFCALAAAADWSLVIAPEIGGALATRQRWVRQSGGRLLGPGERTTAIASDKQRCAEHLAAHGMPIPPGVGVDGGVLLPPDFPYPAVIKPLDGAGSEDTRLLFSIEDAATFGAPARAARLEEYVSGLPASVVVLCGPEERVPLIPCRQHIADDDRCTYLGGSLPLPEELAERATRLATAAVAALPDPLGYLGVDVVLGEEAARDVVIEINARLTTSYVGLRHAAVGNLAQAMLDIAAGRPGDVRFRPRRIDFTAEGGILRSTRWTEAIC
ncbi:MAG: ATP-grasp domain-containing protein [Planctomycetota bacterium]|nr:MAG: ATP-grasp domain-containing protein [Planctomycetota bacterium]REK27772.1 MAG: ATP-grasp domain-containing protein [Planctomycetota bacterium]REK43261.1 MAG: ATP-grasp domain-containing protein [Planctomycetota bacterium]